MKFLFIKSNPGKWIRKNLLAGNAVTAGNILEWGASEMGYKSTGEFVDAVIHERVKWSDISAKLGDRLSGELADAVIQAKTALDVLLGQYYTSRGTT